MSPRRLIAAVFVLVALVTLSAVVFNMGSEPETAAAPTLPPPMTSSSEADFAAIVESDSVTAPLPEEEQALTELAQTAQPPTTVVESTTTTAPPSTTTTSQKPAQQPQPTSPPATTATTSPPATSPPNTVEPGYLSGAESEFGSLINSHRSANGLGSLSRDGSLDAHARAWAKQMAANGSLGHSAIGSLLPPWSAVGENVGSGGSVSGIFDALVGSSGHNANMVGDYTHMGIGVWRDARGVLWTTHVFAR